MSKPMTATSLRMPMTQEQMRRAAAVEYALGGPQFHGDLPPDVKDRICTHVGVRLGWRDRLKVLFGWELELEVRTNTENVVGYARSFTDIHFFRPDWLTQIMHRRFNKRVGVAIVVTEGSEPKQD